MATAVLPPSNPHTPSHELATDPFQSHATVTNLPSFIPLNTGNTPIHTPGQEPNQTWERTEKQATETAVGATAAVTGALSSLGQAAYNAVPDSLKGTMSNEPPTAPHTVLPVVVPGGGVGDLPGAPHETKVAMLPLERRDMEHVKVHGVGDLPGNASETSVAKLPDERIVEAENQNTWTGAAVGAVTGAAAMATGVAASAYNAVRSTVAGSAAPSSTTQDLGAHTGGVGDLPGAPTETGVAKLPLERDIEREIEENRGKPPVGGVGDLPGHPQEANVAMLPLEKEMKGLTVATPDFVSKTGGVGDLPGGPEDTSVAKLPLEREIEKTSTEPKSVPEKFEEKFKTTDKQKEPAADTKPQVETEHHINTEPKDKQRHDNEDGEKSPSSPGKVGFMTKLKGEMKIVAGKVTNNDAKVEHGKAIKSGELDHKGTL